MPVPEPADLTPLARISADKAMAAALAAYPGARVKALALENEDGCLVYRLLLSSGLEVKVDAGNGRVLGAEPEDERGEQEAVQLGLRSRCDSRFIQLEIQIIYNSPACSRAGTPLAHFPSKA